MADTSNTQPKVPHVMIVGAGVSGLLFAILLKRANIPFDIYERAQTVKPLGAIMSLNVNILPVFEQLGLYDDLMKISFTSPGMHVHNENLKEIGYRDNDGIKTMAGYDYIVFSRPQLYDLLLAQLDADKVHFGKKLVSIKNLLEGVEIHCADNTSYSGDILVGADGAYSAVRQSMYKELSEKNQLPFSDTQGLQIGYITMVGTSDSLDEDKYAELKDDFTHFHFIIGKGKPYTWSTFTVPGKRICWGVQIQLKATSAEDREFKNTEWGPEGNEAMIKEVYDFPTTYGPLGQLIDATPRERISKVFLEEKMFETWFSDRVVLIGDAAHKMLPSAGQGAVNAMQDAVILSNCLYDIANDATPKNIATAFKEYKDQRYPHVKFQFDSSKLMAKVIFGQTWSERLLRRIVFGYLPKSMLHRDTIKAAAYRPQCTFLPLTPSRGTHPPLPQKPSKRYQEEQSQLNKTSTAAATA
ncbi:hypothetical protein BC939DRAFT_493329 [Gamsiella multidivaricata]|uniref:uncharacterized protein n=1 Tax=Gamsiella multidivaricata TaxID=101098 RepID=UPI00221F4B01|nr:uncharacterized protein BC939DRAFT_493329 [Gamsiella multidivaricata]KAG0354422.1 hypothetical protein BGZ54_001644 [Gamsiella multidivaricata]KAI7822855.1 hypothetical protein BC939DRAFT_493329 [Gamsiella multidivaricata]